MRDLSRMLKRSASFVLDSSKSSTCPRGHASGFDSPPALLTAFLSILREYSPIVPHMRMSEIPSCAQSVSAAC